MDVQLLDENSRKPIAMLFDVDNLSSLSEIREMIVDQVSEVIPSNEYMFIHHGIAVCRRQESKLTIEKTALNSGDPLFRILPLSFIQVQSSTQTEHLVSNVEPSGVSDLLSTSLAGDSDHISCEANNSNDAKEGNKQIYEYGDHKCPTSDANTQSNKKMTMLKLRSPSNAELRNLKIYSPAEIEIGKGKEPQYRRFWNKTVQKLAKEKISNKEIQKRVNDMWKLHRSKLFQLETEEIEEKSKDIEEAQVQSGSHSQEHKMKKVTLPRNMQRVREASSSVESVDEEVRLLEQSLKRRRDMDQSKIKETRENLKKAKIRLDASKSELRKAQDTLRKNLGVKKAELTKYL